VTSVRYPFLPSHPQYELARSQMTAGGTVVTFEIDGGKPKVSYGTRPPAANAAPGIRRDRKPVHVVTPRYPRKLAENPNVPKTVMQLAYVGVAEDGAVTGVTVAPMLYYREFEPVLVAAIRQWKYAPQDRSWCGEVEFLMTLE